VNTTTKPAGGSSKASNGKGVEPQEDAEEEEPYSEPDVVEEGEDDIDLDEEVEPLGEDEEEEDTEEGADQMELDEKELTKDAKGSDTKAEESDGD